MQYKSEQINKKELWLKVDQHNEEIMKRMQPAVMIPGFVIGFMVIAGCLFKGYMGW